MVSTDGRYVQVVVVSLEFPPGLPPLVSTGVGGPRSLALSGAVAQGTILTGIRGPAEILRAREFISEGQAEVGVVGHHRLTVFAARPDAVVEQFQSLIDAGAGALILVPIGLDPGEQLQIAMTEIVPALIRS
jgi:alkanesulfonate monooxygenase SsuD/methylene tetrahydromethanopterin reductase-like flavin-dependent oxidoreductase (luciferase family)